MKKLKLVCTMLTLLKNSFYINCKITILKIKNNINERNKIRLPY